MCEPVRIMCKFCTRTNILSFLVLGFCAIFSNAAIMGDECDWTGSGLTTPFASGRGVTPVYLRCTAGKVTWMYPQGALRVLLRLPGQDRDFRACIKVHRKDKKHASSARMFLEGPRSLLSLYSHNDGGSKGHRCFNSKNGQVAIYVEATDGDSVNKRVFEVEYDLQPLPRGVHHYDPTDECRPCSGEELAQAFCTSDLVTRGIIYGVEHNHDYDVSQMAIKVTKLIRHSFDDSREIESNSILQYDEDDGDNLKEVTVHVAKHCGVSHGLGEFVFMASRKLGDLTLKCAPRLEDWAVLMHKLSEEGKAHCVLKS